MHKHPALYMRREPPEMRQFLLTLIIITTISMTMFNSHFRSSQVDSTLGESSAHYPGRFFLGRAFRTTPSVGSSAGDRSAQPSLRDSEVHRIESPGFGKRPTTLVVFPAPSQRSVIISSTQKGRESPILDYLRRFDARPDLSDLRWTSSYPTHTIRRGPSDRPVFL